MSEFASSLLPPEAQLVLKSVDDRLTEYVTKMAPGVRITSNDGGFQQRQLWQGVIQTLLKQRADVFLVGWAHFLKVVAENRAGVFSPAYMNRFREELTLTVTERRNFERMLHLAYVTAEQRTRVLSMKQLDMHQILSGLPSEDQRQKVTAFYEL